MTFFLVKAPSIIVNIYTSILHGRGVWEWNWRLVHYNINCFIFVIEKGQINNFSVVSWQVQDFCMNCKWQMPNKCCLLGMICLLINLLSTLLVLILAFSLTLCTSQCESPRGAVGTHGILTAFWHPTHRIMTMVLNSGAVLTLNIKWSPPPGYENSGDSNRVWTVSGKVVKCQNTLGLVQ